MKENNRDITHVIKVQSILERNSVDKILNVFIIARNACARNTSNQCKYIYMNM